MPRPCAPPGAPSSQYTKSAGYSPLPGYVLLEPLGRGGFGEVWKCEAPGGLHKAVKFVAGDETDSVLAGATESSQLRQEFDAFQQVKAIRHPFLLSLERVELIDGELIMVMELADQQLGDRFEECRAAGRPGIPRDELICYLFEAAEALDMIGAKYGLQHLDVKPANLFLMAGHVKVGDYGLVSRLDGRTGANTPGLTPRYAAPEVLRGQIHTRSDQYSLALVYFELLTGAFPYNARNVQQMMMQHLSVAPDLTALPSADRGPVGTALAKDPEGRFASCSAFVSALHSVGRAALVTPGQRRSGPVPAKGHVFSTGAAGAPTRGPGSADETARYDAAVATPVPPRPKTYPTPHDVLTPAPVEQMATRRVPPALQVPQINAVVPVAWVLGRGGAPAARRAEEVVSAVVRAAEAGVNPQAVLNTVTRERDGAWACRFLTTMDPRVAQVKLELLWEEGGVSMDTRTEGRVVFRKPAPTPPPSTGFFGFGKKAAPPESGLEVVVELPPAGRGTVEIAARGAFYGSPPPEFVRANEKVVVRLLDGIRGALGNVEERRKHPRLPATFPLTLYPLHSDGRVEGPVRGFCQDVSPGGLALVCSMKPPSKYAYIAFDDVPGVAGLALLVQFTRSETRHNEVLLSGRYRLDVDSNQ